MNNLHTIQLINDCAAARGQTLTYDDVTQRLHLPNGDPLVRTFLTRQDAEKWAADQNAHVAPARKRP